jgi:acyl carrier protein
MEQETLIAQLRTELRTVKPKLPESIAPNDHFRQDWGLDSLELVEYVARIEQHYKILIPDEDLAALHSLYASAQYVQQKIAAA